MSAFYCWLRSALRGTTRIDNQYGDSSLVRHSGSPCEWCGRKAER